MFSGVSNLQSTNLWLIWATTGHQANNLGVELHDEVDFRFLEYKYDRACC